MKYLFATLFFVSFGLYNLPAHAEIPNDVSEPSLFFTQDEMMRIYQASEGVVSTTGAPGEKATAPVVDPGPRVLKLAGVLYHNDNDWVIWFNGMRVIPKHLPDRMLDVMVRTDKVAIKWLDRGTNRIINLVLRPHQEYHIDSDTITIGTER